MEFLRTSAHQLRLTGVALALLLASVWMAVPARAQQGNREYALKAVFLFNFCQFIDWPQDAFGSDSAPIIIGVLGDNPFGSLLIETVQGEVIRGRNIRVVNFARPQDVRNCHILFAPASAPGRTKDYLNIFAQRNIVTVGETSEFLTQGGMFALVAAENRVRLRVNLSAARSARIEISSKLLRVADVNR